MNNRALGFAILAGTIGYLFLSRDSNAAAQEWYEYSPPYVPNTPDAEPFYEWPTYSAPWDAYTPPADVPANGETPADVPTNGDTPASIPEWFRDWMQPQPGEFIKTGFTMTAANWKVNEYPTYAEFIANVETKLGIPTDLLARLLYQESRYRADIISGAVRSSAGAIGIGQFMPGTAAEMHVNPYDPWESIDGAGRYLRKQFNSFGSWEHALMAYNWGPGNVRKFLRGEKTPPQETQLYVAQISKDVTVV